MVPALYKMVKCLPTKGTVISIIFHQDLNKHLMLHVLKMKHLNSLILV